MNLNLLGEAVLGEQEAERRMGELIGLLQQPAIDYVSVKVSAIAPQLNHFAHDHSLRRVCERLEVLFRAAASTEPATFINLDMEEYHDLDLTMTAFMTVLDRTEFRDLNAGIVLQAYLPDAFEAMQELVTWANRRAADGSGQIKIRLVKGANLAMERVDAAMNGWQQAPFQTKVESDAGYKKCIDWLLIEERMSGVTLGLASHNLFDVAWTLLLSAERGVADRVQFEMLQGMAPAQAKVVAGDVPDSRLLMYTPAVSAENFDVAISYLFRRLEENASDDNFMRHLFRLASDPATFAAQAQVFRDSLKLRDTVSAEPRRHQDRWSAAPVAAYAIGSPFRNEPDTDPVLRSNRAWLADRADRAALAGRDGDPVSTELTTSIEALDRHLATARSGAEQQRLMPLEQRQRLLHRVGDELARRRGDLIVAMMTEANKTVAEADGEVSEAVDFARYYGDRARDLDQGNTVRFEPFGVVAVVPPWNFPVAIPAGGVLAALAAGNSVILKPAPQTPGCAEMVAEACWAAGVDREVLQLVRTPDDAVGRHLVEAADGVVLTGSEETADLFRSWKPGMRLRAETSGKNAMIISPNADIDLAVADLAKSAFSHSGQKCSAASLAILVGDVYRSERFRRQLADAVQSLSLGPATRLETDMGPLVGPPNDRLARAMTELDGDERWLVEPHCLDSSTNLWSPGVRLGVRPGSWFHRTECFGPVLGLMQAETLDDAIRIQNSSEFGLTGGIHTLDPDEIDRWLASVEVGNAYVNRPITGAIVQRQPFGGWKRSSVGPGAKAGGPNYVASLGSWRRVAPDHATVEGAEADYRQAWSEHFSVSHDPTGLFCEANVFRYVAIGRILLRFERDASARDVSLTRTAAAIAGVEVVESRFDEETQVELAARLAGLGVDRIRLVGGAAGHELHRVANTSNIHIADAEVTTVGRIELQHYVREQSVTRTLHRFGNLITHQTG